jgi:hypothetical protein
MGVHELAKDPGIPCAHLTAEGCAIYDSRPPTCRAFYCHWLEKESLLTVSERPDKSKVLCYLAGSSSAYRAETKKNVFVALEVEPGAFETNGILARISKDTLTMTVIGKFLRGLVGPPDLCALGRSCWLRGKNVA